MVLDYYMYVVLSMLPPVVVCGKQKIVPVSIVLPIGYQKRNGPISCHRPFSVGSILQHLIPLAGNII